MAGKKIDKASISTVLYMEKGWNRLDKTADKKQYTSIFVLTDSNTNQHCLPLFDNHFQHPYTILTMEAGETQKHLATCEDLWASLSEQGADRNSLLINLAVASLPTWGALSPAPTNVELTLSIFPLHSSPWSMPLLAGKLVWIFKD